MELAEKPVAEWSSAEIHTHVAALWEQVSEIRRSTCDTLHAKYTSILSSDDRTQTLSDDVLISFENIKPLFDQMQQVRIPVVVVQHVIISVNIVYSKEMD